MLPRLQRRGHSLNVAEVVGPKGVVVTSAERGPRLDHFRHATRIRHRKTLAPVQRGVGMCVYDKHLTRNARQTLITLVISRQTRVAV